LLDEGGNCDMAIKGRVPDEGELDGASEMTALMTEDSGGRRYGSR